MPVVGRREARGRPADRVLASARRERALPVWTARGAAALLVVAAVLGLASSSPSGAGGEAATPDVGGMRLDRAIKAIEKAGLSVSHRDDVKDKDRSRWRKSQWWVINQEPPAGTTVADGTKVRLGTRRNGDLSWPGQAPVVVPQVTGLRLDKAKTALRHALLRASSFDAVRTGRPRKQKNDKNWVIVSQDPAAEAATAGGDRVRLGVRHKTDRVESPVAAAGVMPDPVDRSARPPVVVGLPAGDDTTVTRVIDGDTIEVAGGSRIRFIGIDTPELTGAPGCFGTEAAAHTRALLPVGTPLRLVYDADRLDGFGRSLAYLYRLPDGLFVNVALARDGFGRQLTVPPNVAHAEEIRAAEAEARAAGRGLWNSCAAPPLPQPATPATPATPAAPPPTARTVPAPASTSAPVRPTTVAPARSGCHPSYQGACVPIASDVDCAGGRGDGPAYVAETDIRVVGPDEYGLDGDGNGLGCERP